MITIHCPKELKPKSNFFIVPKEIVQNINLSSKARLFTINFLYYQSQTSFSIEKIAKELGFNRNTTSKIIKELVDLGLLKTIEVSKNGIYKNVAYKLNFSAQDSSDKQNPPKISAVKKGAKGYIFASKSGLYLLNLCFKAPKIHNAQKLGTNNRFKKQKEKIYKKEKKESANLSNLNAFTESKQESKIKLESNLNTLSQKEKQAFGKWIAYKQTLTKKELSSAQILRQLAKFLSIKNSGKDACEAVEFSLHKKYLGIYAPSASAKEQWVWEVKNNIKHKKQKYTSQAKINQFLKSFDLEQARKQALEQITLESKKQQEIKRVKAQAQVATACEKEIAQIDSKRCFASAQHDKDLTESKQEPNAQELAVFEEFDAKDRAQKLAMLNLGLNYQPSKSAQNFSFKSVGSAQI